MQVLNQDVMVNVLNHAYKRGTGRHQTLSYHVNNRFLRTLFGRSVQEMRPNRYPSRHFGVGYMNVQKVLRRKTGEPVERWKHHWSNCMFGCMIDLTSMHLKLYLNRQILFS